MALCRTTNQEELEYSKASFKYKAQLLFNGKCRGRRERGIKDPMLGKDNGKHEAGNRLYG